MNLLAQLKDKMNEIQTLEKSVLLNEQRQEERKARLREFDAVFVATIEEIKFCISIGIGKVVLVSDDASVNNEMAREAREKGITAIPYSEVEIRHAVVSYQG